MVAEDAMDALPYTRPSYRPCLGIEAALDEIEAQRGARFDPTVVDACQRLFRARGYSLPG